MKSCKKGDIKQYTQKEVKVDVDTPQPVGKRLISKMIIQVSL